MEYMGNQQYWDQKFCLRTGHLPPEQLLTEELSLFTGKHGAGSCRRRLRLKAQEAPRPLQPAVNMRRRIAPCPRRTSSRLRAPS